MAAKLTWTTRSVRVSELKLLDYNPRKISEADKRKLMASLEKFGVADIPVCNTDGTVISGNQRVTALRDLGRGEEMLDVRWPGRRLTTREVKEYAVTANTHAGEWDFDILKEHFSELPLVDFGLGVVEDFAEGGKDRYTKKILSPVYEPTHEKPAVEDLHDLTKVRSLLVGIDNLAASEGEKEFLRVAAYRHAVINYQRVADYYAHSQKEVQEVMEDSALVILDYDRAVELGYMKLGEEMAAIFEKEYPEEE